MASASGGFTKLTDELLQGELCYLPRLEPHEFTNGLVVRLHEFHGTSSRSLVLQLKQLAPLGLLPEIEKSKEGSIRKRADAVWKDFKKIKQNVKKDLAEVSASFLNAPFQLPKSRSESSLPAQSTSATGSKLKQAQKDLKSFKRKCAQAEHENEQLEERYELVIQEYYSTVSLLHQNAENFQQIIDEKSAETNELQKGLTATNKSNAELTSKLDSLQARLAKTSNVRSNVNKKLRRREETLKKREDTIKEHEQTIKEQEETIQQLEAAASEADVLREAEVQGQMRLRVEEQISELQKKKIKSLQDSRRKLNLRLEKAEEEKQQVQADLEATVEVLTDKLKNLQTENTELQEIQSLMESEVVTTFRDGKYSDDIREVIMDLLTSGVSMRKVDSVINTVLSKLAGKSVDRLPSLGLKSRLIIEARILAQRQVAEAIIAGTDDTERGNCLHQDGTSKWFRKYQTFDVTLPSGKTLTMSMTEVPSGDAEGILSAFSESCRELAEVLCSPGEDVAKKTAEIITSFTSTMSDRGATNPLFNRHLEEMRRELLPVAKNEWDTLADDVKDDLCRMCNYFCKMHLLVNFATEANATLKLFEDAVSEGSNPFAFSQQGESGAARLIRTACSAFTDHGNEKSGAPQYFQSFLSHQTTHDTNYMVTYRGNRFNILFYNGAAVYYHHKQIVDFISSWPDPNGLLKAVKADASQKVYLAGVRALGILDKTVTGPFFRILSSEKNVLGMNTHLHQMQIGLERWSQDASTLLAGEPLYSEAVVERHKDALFESLFADTEDVNFDVLTQQALEVVCAALLILLERQAEEQLPGGKYWKPTEKEVEESQHVPTTNVVSERDFAIVDNLLRAKPYGTSLSLEAYLLWMNNQTSTWLRSLSPEEKKKHMEYARTHASKVHERFKEKSREIKDKRLQTLLARQKEKEERRKKARLKKVALTEKVMKLGGVWRTAEEVEDKIKALNREQEKLDALKCQLQFHKQVLKSEGSKELFQMTVTRQGTGRHVFSSEEKASHLQEVISTNMGTATADINSESEDEEEEREFVTLKEPDARTVQDIHTNLSQKRAYETERREVRNQKLSLPDYLKDPAKLVGCKVKHKCFSKDLQGNKVAKWFSGKVTKMIAGAEDPKNTDYCIVYDDENEPDEIFNLLVDMEKGDLVVNNDEH